MAPTYCAVTKKLGYITRQFAKKKAKQYLSRFGIKERPYVCPFCGKFHLTKNARKGKRDGHQ